MYTRIMNLLAWFEGEGGGGGAAAGGGSGAGDAGAGGGAAGGAPGGAAAPQQSGPQPSAVEQASIRAREVLKGGGTLEQLGGEAGKPPHHSQTQARNEQGEFTEEERAAQAAAAAAGEKPPVEAKASTEGSPGETGQTEGEPGAEGGAEAGVELPALFEGEEPIMLELDDPEAQTRLQSLVERSQMLDSYTQREQHFSEQVEQLEEVRSQMEVDPGGYLLGMIPNNKDLVVHLTRYLLTQPQVWEALGKDVINWDDPEKLRLAAAEARAERGDYKERLRTQIDDSKATRKNFDEIHSTISAMIPTTMAKDQQNLFFADALRDLQYYAERNRLKTLPVRDVPTILAARLRAFGIDPVAAAARAQNGKKGDTNGKPAGGAPGSTQKTGAEFVAGAKARDNLARGGPSAGAPGTAQLAPPTGMGIEETLKWHRDQVKGGKSLLAR